jgi:threonine synthase
METRDRRANTLASAIEINRPVNLTKCLRALDACHGVVRETTDAEILDAKAMVGAGGFGCEPASAASVAGARLLRQQGIIGAGDRVVCVLTGHQLKDPDATVGYHSVELNEKLEEKGVTRRLYQNSPVVVENDFSKIMELVQRLSAS